MDEYITTAKEKYGYNGEQALGMLFWHKHDLSRASLDLANFTPFPDEWTVEDKVLFEQAFQFHGKSFHRIRQMVSNIFCFGKNHHLEESSLQMISILNESKCLLFAFTF